VGFVKKITKTQDKRGNNGVKRKALLINAPCRRIHARVPLGGTDTKKKKADLLFCLFITPRGRGMRIPAERPLSSGRTPKISVPRETATSVITGGKR